MLFFRREERYVLDSSSIIDGRVVNLFEKRFLEGKIIIPYLARIIARRQFGPDAERVINHLKKSLFWSLWKKMLMVSLKKSVS